jgi:hypothetical protein
MFDYKRHKSLINTITSVVLENNNVYEKELELKYGKYSPTYTDINLEEDFDDYEFVYVKLDENDELISFATDEEYYFEINELNARAKELKKAFRAGRQKTDRFYGNTDDDDDETRTIKTDVSKDKAAKAAMAAGQKSASDNFSGKTTGQNLAKGQKGYVKAKYVEKPNLPKDVAKAKSGNSIAIDNGGKRAVVSHSGSVNVAAVRDKIKKFNKDQRAAGRKGVKIQFFDRKDGGKVYVTGDDSSTVKRAAGLV